MSGLTRITSTSTSPSTTSPSTTSPSTTSTSTTSPSTTSTSTTSTSTTSTSTTSTSTSTTHEIAGRSLSQFNHQSNRPLQRKTTMNKVGDLTDGFSELSMDPAYRDQDISSIVQTESLGQTDPIGASTSTTSATSAIGTTAITNLNDFYTDLPPPPPLTPLIREYAASPPEDWYDTPVVPDEQPVTPDQLAIPTFMSRQTTTKWMGCSMK
jgi:hypothetical protein